MCQERGWKAEWYEDTGGHRSGRSVKNRPQWQALEKRLSDSNVVALVANDLSRLHRKGWRIGALLEYLEKHNVALVTASGSGIQIDTSSMQGRIFVQLAALFDEYYAEDVSAKARDSIRHRRQQGKVVGRVPFGTKRDENGYLIPSDEGVWLLSDGTFVDGTQDKYPHPDAIWRGYFQTAYRMMEIFAEGKLGMARISYQLNDEGWCYRTARGKSRAIERDDVRSVIANWKEYGGIITATKGRARNRAGYVNLDLDQVVFDEERSVMPVDLLRRVAQVRHDRSHKPRKATHNTTIPYPLAMVVRCELCSQINETGQPAKRATLQGYTTSAGVRRYRHSPGMKCETKKRSVLETVLNREFERLIDNLIIKQEYLDIVEQMLSRGIASLGNPPEEQDLHNQKTEGIAQCRRRMERAKFLFIEGDISEDDYVRTREINEQEIAHWQARTTVKDQLLIEVATVLATLSKLKDVWFNGTMEDKKGLVQSTFEYILFDMDTDRITDFRLKPWADQYVIIRAEMIVEEHGEMLQNSRDSQVDLRDSATSTRHKATFEIPVSTSTATKSIHPNKELLKQMVIHLHDLGMSYREIGKILNIHWTQVGRIIKQAT